MTKGKNDKRTKNDLQHITHKAKDRASRAPLNTGVNSGAPEGIEVPAVQVAPVMLLLLQTR
jgi:phage gp46-like protein